VRRAVNAFLSSSGAAALALALLAAAASGEDGDLANGSPRAGADRWVPSLAATSGLTIQEWKGRVTTLCAGCATPDPALRLPGRSAASGVDLAVTPFVGGEFELMTPELGIPTSPRLFVGGGVLGAFGFERRVAREGNPGTLASPIPANSQSTTPYSENFALGQGSETTAQVDTFVYGARAGVAFPLELFDRSFRLKPSVGWVHYKVDAKGQVSDAECETVPTPSGTNCNSQVPPGSLRAIQLSGSASERFDGIGGGLDLEMDTLRIGPLGSSLFIGAHAFRILGNREIAFGASASFPDSGAPGLGAATVSSFHRVELDAVMVRVGLGLRVHWLGAGD